VHYIQFPRTTPSPRRAERQTIAEGEFFRPALTAGADGKLYLAVSVHDGDTWKIAVASGQGSKWSKLETISSGGPDISPRAAVDSGGRLWVVWQAYRGGRSRILARMFNGSWQGETAVSENTRNAWGPAIAIDSKGPHAFRVGCLRRWKLQHLLPSL
jgi:hypothetical protein